MAHDDTPPRICTFIFEGYVSNVGAVGVVIDGVHDTGAEGFVTLNHKLIPVFVTPDELEVIEDPKLRDQLLEFATLYLYMIEGDIATSDAQTVQIDEEHFQLNVTGYGMIDITPIGVIGVVDDGIDEMYQIAIANPSPGTHLVIILEIIDTDPLEFQAIDLKDGKLVTGVIMEFLVQIGAIESEEEADDDEEDTDNSATPEDDTVVPGQYWNLGKDIGEA